MIKLAQQAIQHLNNSFQDLGERRLVATQVGKRSKKVGAGSGDGWASVIGGVDELGFPETAGRSGDSFSLSDESMEYEVEVKITWP